MLPTQLYSDKVLVEGRYRPLIYDCFYHSPRKFVFTGITETSKIVNAMKNPRKYLKKALPMAQNDEMDCIKKNADYKVSSNSPQIEHAFVELSTSMELDNERAPILTIY